MLQEKTSVLEKVKEVAKYIVRKTVLTAPLSRHARGD